MDRLADMRRFALLGGIGWYLIHSSRGTVPIAIDEINACGTDEELSALVIERCGISAPTARRRTSKVS